jgi:hypothetical protein
MPEDCMRRSFAWVRAAAVGKFAAALLGVATAAGGATGPAWPDFLPRPDRFPPDVVDQVARVWKDPTLTRTVEGPSAAVPLDVYLAFVDAPDVTTAAARFLHIGKQEVRALGDDLYEASDGGGARGRYRVLAREEHRRVILSWGRHRGAWLGTIRGKALTVIDFSPRDGGVDQRLTAYVLIENAVAARLARVFAPIFGGLADRKLTEAFTVVARVTAWAMEHPDEFCEWFARESLADGRYERVQTALDRCGAPGGNQAARPDTPYRRPRHSTTPR